MPGPATGSAFSPEVLAVTVGGHEHLPRCRELSVTKARAFFRWLDTDGKGAA